MTQLMTILEDYLNWRGYSYLRYRYLPSTAFQITVSSLTFSILQRYVHGTVFRCLFFCFI